MGNRMAIYLWTVISHILEEGIHIDSLATLSRYSIQWIYTSSISQNRNLARVTERLLGSY